MGKTCSKTPKPKEPNSFNLSSKKTPDNQSFYSSLKKEPFEPEHYQAHILACAYACNTELVFDFLEQGFPINYPLNQKGWRLVHVAAQLGDLKVFSLLIGKGADINAKEYTQDWTPLMIAAINSNLEVVKFLVAQGADTTLKDTSKKRAVDLAFEYNSKVFEYLNYVK